MKFLPNSVNTSCDFKDFGVERCPECNALWKRDQGHECTPGVIHNHDGWCASYYDGGPCNCWIPK